MGLHPFTQPPKVKDIDQWLGMVRDRSGTEVLDNEFKTLDNIDNILTQSLQKRLGTIKFGSVTHATGSLVRSGMTYTNSAAVKTFLKLVGGQLYKWTAGSPGSWSTVGAAVFTDVTTFLKQLMTHKTGAAASTTGTATAADSTTVTDGAATMTVNQYVGFILSIHGQQKVIVGNNATIFYLAEPFDDIPVPTDTYNVYARQQEIFIATGTEFYKCDGTTLTQIDNSVYALAFKGIELHDNRLWGWKNNRVYWSDTGLGEHFSRNNWKDFASDVTMVADLAEVLVVYEAKAVTVKFNSDPTQFFWRKTLTGYGTSSPGSVAVYPGIQFFLDPTMGVMYVSLKSLILRALSPWGDEIEPLSASLNYINTMIFAHTTAEINAATSWINNGNYYLRIGSDLFVLHVLASITASQSQANLQQTHWIWTHRTYPAAQIPAWIGEYDADLVFGGSTNGQIYAVNQASVYSDDGTAITQTLEKVNWNADGSTALKSFDALYFTMDKPTAPLTYNVYLLPGGVTFGGTPDLTFDPSNSDVDRNSILKIPSNPSDTNGRKDAGTYFSLKVVEVSSLATTSMENLELHYYQGILS